MGLILCTRQLLNAGSAVELFPLLFSVFFFYHTLRNDGALAEATLDWCTGSWSCAKVSHG